MWRCGAVRFQGSLILKGVRPCRRPLFGLSWLSVRLVAAVFLLLLLLSLLFFRLLLLLSLLLLLLELLFFSPRKSHKGAQNGSPNN